MLNHNSMGKVLLFGNGLNLLSHYLSWKDLLAQVQAKDENKLAVHDCLDLVDIPYPLQYDYMLLSSDFHQKVMTVKDNAGWKKVVEDRQFALKKAICDEMKAFSPNAIYKQLASLPFDAYLTTNYDHVLDVCLVDMGYQTAQSDKSETNYNIRRKRCLQKGSDLKSIYPIHGDMDNPRSIVIGYNHYCGTVAKISDYLKGNYKWKDGKDGEQKISSMLERLQNNDEKRYSWIDHIFMSDVYIVGLGLDYSEIDLWWLLDRRQRMVRGEGVMKQNKIVYFVTKDFKNLSPQENAKVCLLERLGVQCRYTSITPGNAKDYMAAYQEIVDMIEKEI